MLLQQKIKQRCKDWDLSVSELERKFGLQKNSFYKWDYSPPPIEVVCKLAIYFEESLDDLLADELKEAKKYLSKKGN